jgi:ubiquinone/menaquinone biosynthesis C-methylase UbiE
MEKNMKRLNIGCGEKKFKGWINLDSSKEVKPDKIHDLNRYPYPFKDNEIDEIYADNVLEHLDSIVKPLEEIWRICRNGAKITIRVPLAPTYWSFLDPTHKQFFTFNTFNYFTKEHCLNYYSKARFKIVKSKILFYRFMKFMEPIVNIHERVQKFYSIFLSNIINPFMLQIVLEVEK